MLRPPPPPAIDFAPVDEVPGKTHDQREFSFRVPEGFEDRTIVAYTLDGFDGRPGASILVKRMRGYDVAACAAREAVALAKTLPFFDLVSSRDVFIGADAAVEQVVRWRASYGPVVQRFVFLQGDPMTVLVVTCTVPAEDAERMRPTFDAALASFRVRRPGGSGFHGAGGGR